MAGLTCLRLVFVLSTFTSLITTRSVNAADVIEGFYEARWVPVTLPRQLVMKGLPGSEFSLDHPDIKGLPADYHLVVFEMGRELNCGPIFPAILRENFMEFKFEIPFLKHRGLSRIFNNKQVIYVDSLVESMGARIGYKLNSSVAEIVRTNNSYSVKEKITRIEAEFQPDGQWENPTNYPYFKTLQDIFSQRWFGNGDFQTCADHHYDFTHAQVRPVKTKLTVTGHPLPGWFLEKTFQLPGIKSPLGGVEVRVNWTMTAPFSCKNQK